LVFIFATCQFCHHDFTPYPSATSICNGSLLRSRYIWVLDWQEIQDTGFRKVKYKMPMAMVSCLAKLSVSKFFGQSRQTARTLRRYKIFWSSKNGGTKCTRGRADGYIVKEHRIYKTS
jgi:hypothetical protein